MIHYFPFHNAYNWNFFINFRCHHDIGQRVIVGPNEEGLILQILPKLFSHGPFQGQEHQFRGVILQLASLEATTGVGHRVITAVVLFMREHCPQPHYGCIGLQQKGLLEVREHQHRCNVLKLPPVLP